MVSVDRILELLVNREAEFRDAFLLATEALFSKTGTAS
jgi:hypothetical protein